MKQSKLAILKFMMHKAAVNLADDDALEAVELFPAWAADTEFAKDIRVRYNGKLYRCERAHTSQSDWTPPDTQALWTEVAKPGEIPVWKQPTGAQDAYMTGDKVHYPDEDGEVYISIVDNNVWQPGVYGWEEYNKKG